MDLNEIMNLKISALPLFHESWPLQPEVDWLCQFEFARQRPNKTENMIYYSVVYKFLA